MRSTPPLRAIKLYPLEQRRCQKTLAELSHVAEELRAEEGELEFRIPASSSSSTRRRLRLDLSNYATFGHILTLCKRGLAARAHLRLDRTTGTARDWTLLLSLLGGEAKSAPSERFHGDSVRDSRTPRSSTFQLDAPTETASGHRELNEETKAAANRTYAQSVAVTKDVINSVRIGKTPNIRKIKRVVQGIVDQVLNEETSLIGLTTMRDYDEYTFTHSVNVCIFSVALGRTLGMTKIQLYELGLAALMHDIGNRASRSTFSRRPAGSPTKSGSGSPRTRGWACWYSSSSADSRTCSYRAMTVCQEHHMKIDLTGYPKAIRPRQVSLLSKIVAIADGYDAATSRRVYRTEVITPSAVLEEMRDNPRRGLDQVLVKAFMNLLGIYPVGTLVVLDTFELAVVSAANPNPDALSRPIVKIISDEQGNNQSAAPGGPSRTRDRREYARTIIKMAT